MSYEEEKQDIVAWADRNSSPENRAHIATILAMLKEAERE